MKMIVRDTLTTIEGGEEGQKARQLVLTTIAQNNNSYLVCFAHSLGGDTAAENRNEWCLVIKKKKIKEKKKIQEKGEVKKKKGKKKEP